jgi:2-polyprenyl-3-methyl-5-hydroxy-6-metoxy-1,4-benzoquinol methylase
MTSNETIETNKRQKAFYDKKRKNFVTKVWYFLRNGILREVRKSLGVEKQLYQLHLHWCGDLSQKKVLDLGCYEGNSLSIHLAQNSKEYIAIDLSENGIAHLNKRIKELPNAKAIAVDFLSEEFNEKDFDLIYAYGVLHHFKDVKMLIGKLKEKLSTNGIIISNDPLQTSLPLKLARYIYRPFQSDRDWEWPFSRKVYYQFKSAFTIKDRRAMLGKAKWLFMVNFIPISAETKISIGKKWHREDWEKSRFSDSHMFKCMHLTMLMQKKD